MRWLEGRLVAAYARHAPPPHQSGVWGQIDGVGSAVDVDACADHRMVTFEGIRFVPRITARAIAGF